MAVVVVGAGGGVGGGGGGIVVEAEVRGGRKRTDYGGDREQRR